MRLKQNKKILFLSTIIFLIILTMIIFSYGYVMTRTYGNSGSKQTSFKSQLLSIKFSDGNETLTSTNDNYFVPGSTITKTFSITNTGTVSSKYSINLANVSNDFNRLQDLTYELKKGEEIISSGLFPTSDISLVTKLIIANEETQNFTLTINYLSSDENQIEDSGKVINANIVLDQNVKTFSKLNIYGNTIIDGIPGLETPASIRNLGSESKNLLDIQDFYNTYYLYTSESYRPTFTTFDGYEVLKIYGTINSDGRNIQYMKGKFKENTQYNFSFDIYDVKGALSNYMGVTFAMVYTDGTEQSILSGVLSDKRKFDMWQHFSVTSNAEKSIAFIRFSYGTGFAYSYIKNFQIEENTINTDYVYNKSINIKNSGKNLFDKEKMITDFRGTVTQLETGIKITSKVTGTYQILTYKIQDYERMLGKTYTFQAKATTSANNKPLVLMAWKNSANKIINTIFESSFNKISKTFTLPQTAPEGTTRIDIYFYINGSGTLNVGDTVEYKDIQLEEGDSATAYEPYQESKSISVNIKKKKNLFDYSKATNEWISATAPYPKNVSSTSRLLNKIEIPNGVTNYTFSVEKVSTTNADFLVAFYDENNNIVSRTGVNSSTDTKIVTTVPANVKYVVAGINSLTAFKNIQLEEGNIKTNYVPYYDDESLMCIENVCDYIDVVNKKIVRNIGKYTITGEEKWVLNSLYTNEHIITITSTDLLKGLGTKPEIKSNYFLYYNSSTMANVGRTSLGKYLFFSFDKEAFANLQDITTWLKNQYANNNPAIVYYYLATPIEEDLDISNLDALEFTNNITACDNSMCSSKIEAEYDT